jgi:phosphopantetheinyl transferase (holo-ACP synthase)
MTYGKDKIFKSHFSLKEIITKALSNEIKYISFKPFRNLKQSESVPIIFKWFAILQ